MLVDIFWGCLIAGLVFGLFSLIFGEVLDGILDAVAGVDFLHPMTILGAVTLFGATGLMLSKFTDLQQVAVVATSIGAGITFSLLIFFGYVKPMSKTESSIAFSERELVGRPATVSIPIPENGFGEVEIHFGVHRTYQIAASMDNTAISADAPVVIVEYRDGAVYVVSDAL